MILYFQRAFLPEVVFTISLATSASDSEIMVLLPRTSWVQDR